jgi:hypothetical protein
MVRGCALLVGPALAFGLVIDVAGDQKLGAPAGIELAIPEGSSLVDVSEAQADKGAAGAFDAFGELVKSHGFELVLR